MINKRTIFAIASLLCLCACGNSQNDKLAQKEKELLQKENDLLKKENDLLKKTNPSDEAPKASELIVPKEPKFKAPDVEKGTGVTPDPPKYNDFEQEKKNMVRNNILNYVTHSLDYTSITFGGFENVIVGINNASDYWLEEVRVQVSYITAYDALYKREYVLVTNIAPRSSKSVYAPNSDRGTKLRSNIMLIRSDMLNLNQSYR